MCGICVHAVCCMCTHACVLYVCCTCCVCYKHVCGFVFMCVLHVLCAHVCKSRRLAPCPCDGWDSSEMQVLSYRDPVCGTLLATVAICLEWAQPPPPRNPRPPLAGAAGPGSMYRQAMPQLFPRRLGRMPCCCCPLLCSTPGQLSFVKTSQLNYLNLNPCHRICLWETKTKTE
jgi:hypothetical protein